MISFIVAISGSSPRRSKNFFEMLACLRLQHGCNFLYKQNFDYEIVVVELVTDGIRYWDALSEMILIPYKAIYDPIFSLSWCYNVGARVAKGDILAFMGADIMCRPDYVDEILRQFKGNFSSGWSECLFFGEVGTRYYYNYREPKPGWLEETGAKSAMPNKETGWGASSLFKSDFFWHIGGYNENYQEWGAEDLEIQRRAITINKTNDQLNYTLYHLYHTERQKNYVHKREMFISTVPYSKQVSKRLVDAQLGDPEKRKLISIAGLETEDISCYG